MPRCLLDKVNLSEDVPLRSTHESFCAILSYFFLKVHTDRRTRKGAVGGYDWAYFKCLSKITKEKTISTLIGAQPTCRLSPVCGDGVLRRNFIKKSTWLSIVFICMPSYGSPDASLWITPISNVALLLLSHDFTSKCMPRHDVCNQTFPLLPLVWLYTDWWQQ